MQLRLQSRKMHVNPKHISVVFNYKCQHEMNAIIDIRFPILNLAGIADNFKGMFDNNDLY